jgi:hypothetical protein
MCRPCQELTVKLPDFTKYNLLRLEGPGGEMYICPTPGGALEQCSEIRYQEGMLKQLP